MIAVLSVCVYGQNGKKFFKAGNEFVANLKYEDAVTQFTSAIGAEPSNPDYYLARGKANEAINKNNEAKADFDKALVFAPKNVDALIRLGAVCNKTGDFDEALKALNRASALDKRNGAIYPEKVITLIGLQRYDMAIRVSDTAVLIKDTPMNYYYRGVIYSKLNNALFSFE